MGPPGQSTDARLESPRCSTFTWIFGKVPNMHELGAYAKAPLLGFGGGSSYSDDWDD